jgi:hypothetical protein
MTNAIVWCDSVVLVVVTAGSGQHVAGQKLMLDAPINNNYVASQSRTRKSSSSLL